MLSDTFFIFIGISFGLSLISFNGFLVNDQKRHYFKLFILAFLGTLFSKFIFYFLSSGGIFSFNGGFVFFGFLFPFFIHWVFLGKTKENIEFYQSLGVALPLGHAIGRLGCFFNYCCFGAISGFDVRLVEAIFLLSICATNSFVTTPEKRFSFYVAAYSIYRFFIEFFRQDKIRGIVGNLSTSQILSMVIIFMLLTKIFFEQTFQERKALT